MAKSVRGSPFPAHTGCFGEPHIRWCLALGGKLGRGVPFIEWEQVWKVFRYDDVFAVEWI